MSILSLSQTGQGVPFSLLVADLLGRERNPTRKRLYAGYLHGAHEDGIVNDEITRKLCQFIKKSKCEEGSIEEQIFFSILEIFSFKKDTSPEERAFFRELLEWTLIGILPKEPAEKIQEDVTSSVHALLGSEIECIRERYSLRASTILDDIREKNMTIDFTSITPEIIPLLSEEVQECMFQMTRRTGRFNRETYDGKIITRRQNRFLTRSIQVIRTKKSDT